ncbi:MAG: zinc-binding dehydrogenase [SAR202 cluster bacterium]|nr:zinc-binding dehydrogenase [SAR202 cluster bacterium]
MKAVYIAQHGGPEVLTYGDRPNPEAGPGDITLRVRASALNRLDLNLRDGKSYKGPLPRVMGCDIAGEVVAISPAARTDLKVGDRVILDNRTKCGVCEACRMGLDQNCSNQKRLGVDLDGGHAEYAIAPASNAYRIPNAMSFTEAAALPIVAHTAWHCLVTQAQIKPWDDVLIQAGGSGVGSMGIQIAKMMGCRVITTAGSDWKLEKAKALGAAEGINYRTTKDISQRVKALTGGKGVDVVFDCVGADTWEQNLLSLKAGGRLVITGVTSGAKATMDLSLLQGKPLNLMGSGGRSRRTFADMMKLVNQGSLHGVVDRVFPLDEVAEAHKVLESREYFGKLVIES